VLVLAAKSIAYRRLQRVQPERKRRAPFRQNLRRSLPVYLTTTLLRPCVLCCVIIFVTASWSQERRERQPCPDPNPQSAECELIAWSYLQQPLPLPEVAPPPSEAAAAGGNHPAECEKCDSAREDERSNPHNYQPSPGSTKETR